MAGVQSKTSTEDIRQYFRKNRLRNQENPGVLNNNDLVSRSSRNNNKQSMCESLGILTDRPKYKQYGTRESRMVSFENWPEGMTQDKRDLVEAGFAYTGVDDCVRCYHCSIKLRDWPEGACPWEQHVLASHKCSHVIQCKGRGFIRNILGEERSDSDIDDSDDVVDLVKLAMKRNEDAVTVAREYCADEETLKAAVKATIKHELDRQFTAVDLVKAIDIIQEKRKQGIHDKETGGENSESEEDIEKTNRKLKNPVTCKICFDAYATIITLPCGHLVSCSQCVSDKCAVCRADIKGTVRAVMAF